MSASRKFSTSPNNLYRRAEEMLAGRPQDYGPTKNVQELIHDLHVHQMELTLQNEELIQTQAQLRESHDAYSDLYDFAPIGYLTIDQEGIITNANLMAATMFGIGRDTLIGRKITAFIFNEDQDIYYFHNQQLLTNRNRQCCEIRLCRNDGEIFHTRLDSISSPSGTDGTLFYKVAITDITQKKNMETELREVLKKAEEANKAKSEFLANMSHEIRTPLNAIVGIINILKVQDYSKERQALYMQTLDDSAKALLELINDMLDFAKIETRMLDLEIKPFSLYDVVQESIHIVTIKAEEKKLRLDLDYPELARLMNGSIEVESKVRKGSVFTLHLPLEPAANKELETNSPTPISPQASENDHRGVKILLVEDYKANILVATHLLEAFGYDYEVARNSYEALVKLKENDFSLILMDIQMEGRDGMETTRIIREMERKQGKPRMPIIAMTAYALTGDREKCLEAGMDAYITKPVYAEELQKALAHFIGNEEKITEHS